MKVANWNQINSEEQGQLLQRPVVENLIMIQEQCKAIAQAVKSKGDLALTQLTAQFDQVTLDQFAVSKQEIAEAKTHIPLAHQQAIQMAILQLTQYHKTQRPQSEKITHPPGVTCQRVSRPIQRVGLYIPGGTAPLVSTVLMLAIPAKIADCPLIVLTSPPNAQGHIDPHILYAADLCGISHIYKAGGAQAIAAMAYGTQTIPKVDKIFGPGNAFVTQTKLLVAQDPAGATYDLPAGPSELMVIADDSSNPEFVAADLLSQAEHGADSQVILVTPSTHLASQVQIAINSQLTTLPRKKIAASALAHSKMIIVNDLTQAMMISNLYAPEHLSLNINDAERWIDHIQCAGAVFIGPWAAETLGDYVTGSNHVLPTYGYARSISGLSVTDFMTFINLQTISKIGLHHIGPAAEIIAKIEGLDAHQRAVSLRLRQIKDENILLENS